MLNPTCRPQEARPALVCTVCGSQSRDAAALVAHMSTHQTASIICGGCRRAFTSRGDLNAHLASSLACCESVDGETGRPAPSFPPSVVHHSVLNGVPPMTGVPEPVCLRCGLRAQSGAHVCATPSKPPVSFHVQFNFISVFS